MNDERWLPVVGYEGLYEVSDHGNVRSLGRDTIVRTEKNYGRRYLRRPQTLRPSKQQKGYMVVWLSRHALARQFGVHVLVAKAFVGIPTKLQPTINHKDGVRDNNHYSNLELASPSEQQRHRFDVLKHPAATGEGHGMAKLTAGKAALIRAMYGTGRYHQWEIGDIFGVGQYCVWAIVSRKTWKSVA